MKENEIGMDREEFKQIQEPIMKIIIEKFTLKEKEVDKVKLRPIRNRRTSDCVFDESSDEDVVFQDDVNDDTYSSINDNTESTRLQQLINYAHPLIVANPPLLEDSFFQLKEIIGTENEIELNDEDLVKLLVRYDYDLNRVIPIVLNCE